MASTIGETKWVEHICPKGNPEKFHEVLGINPDTPVKLLHEEPRKSALLQYYRVERGPEIGRVVEVTTSLDDSGHVKLATARWLSSPAAVSWLKFRVFELRGIDAQIAMT